tara:strand:- start:730 stop:1446 length:717 start_codon:yes stop_codon:yes gene_type:complete
MPMEKKGRLSESDFRKMSDDDPRKQSWSKAQKKYGEQGRFADKKRSMESARSRAGGSSRESTAENTNKMSRAKGLAAGRRESQQMESRSKATDRTARRQDIRSRGIQKTDQRRDEYRGAQDRRSMRREDVDRYRSLRGFGPRAARPAIASKSGKVDKSAQAVDAYGSSKSLPTDEERRKLLIGKATQNPPSDMDRQALTTGRLMSTQEVKGSSKKDSGYAGAVKGKKFVDDFLARYQR